MCLSFYRFESGYLEEGIDHGGNVVLLAGVGLSIPKAWEEVRDSVHVTRAF